MPSYDQITGPNKPSSNVEHAYVFVLPKSGTVYLGIFFTIYGYLLRGKIPDEQTILNRSLPSNAFGKLDFLLRHSECPGYVKTETDPAKLAAWKKLNYFTSGWVGDPAILRKAGTLMEKHVGQHMITNNQKMLESYKIVFTFRNPLDEVLSYWRHQWYSVTSDHKYKTGKTASSLTLEEFIFNEGGLDSWIKEFYSYVPVSQHYPDLILFVPYEQLINNKSVALGRMINHLGLPFNEKAFLIAMNFTSKENLIALENRIGKSIGGDQSLASERHIRNGGIGVWQSQMTVDMVMRIESRLNQFGLSLSMFYVADQLEPRFQFITTLTAPQTNSVKARARP